MTTTKHIGRPFGSICKQVAGQPIVAVGCNVVLIMLIYTLLRLFFYYVNREMYPHVSGAHLVEMLCGGMRFDLTAILYLSSVYILMMLLPLRARYRKGYRTAVKWFFLIPNLLGIAVNGVDTVYTRFTDRRTTITFFSEFQNDGNLASVFFQAVVQYWYVTLFVLAMMACLVLCYRQLPEQDDDERIGWWYYVRETLILLVACYFVVIGIRGGFGKYTRPITLSNALQYTNTPAETNIVLNTPFSLMRSTEGSVYVNPHYYADSELEARMSPIHPKPDSIHSSTPPMNVVVLILESFSKEYIGFYNHALEGGTYQGYTPFLDSLLNHCITYEHSFASGRKSIDAMPSILSSIPMLIDPYVVTPYSTDAVSSIAACLRPKGYSTAFFHGAPNGSMGFQAYARAAGFEHYYGMDEYDGPEAFDGTWAIWDEEFLQYYARTMTTMPEPFMTAVFTASSHHPFRVPERYAGVYPAGTQPIHPCIGYSDNALRQFFAYAKSQPWYDHTLFVITADHTNQLTHAEYTTAKGVFEVPIAFFCPAHDAGEVRMQPVSQTDIMPSVLAQVGYDEPYFAFGEDALTHPKAHPYAICYHHPVYQIFSDSLLVQFNGQEPTAIYDYVADPLLLTNRLDDLQDQSEVQTMLHYLKAYIQQYISRLTTNRMTIQTN